MTSCEILCDRYIRVYDKTMGSPSGQGLRQRPRQSTKTTSKSSNMDWKNSSVLEWKSIKRCTHKEQRGTTAFLRRSSTAYSGETQMMFISSACGLERLPWVSFVRINPADFDSERGVSLPFLHLPLRR